MASDKQTMDLHTRRMVISANPIKGHKRQFYSWAQGNKNSPTSGLFRILVAQGGIDQGRGCFILTEKFAIIALLTLRTKLAVLP
jgi:hypothetical protein